LCRYIQAAEEVAVMQTTLSEAKVVVEAKTKEVNELLEAGAYSRPLFSST
jgi:hypothetical protein